MLGKKVILAGERHAVAQKPGLVIDRVPGNGALLLEHEIFKGSEKRNFLRKAGKPGLDLRDFCILLEGLHLNYIGDGELTDGH